MIVQKTFRIKGGREFFYPLLHPFCIPIKKLFFDSISSSPPPFHIPFHFRVWNRGIPDDATKWIRWRKNLWKRKGGREKKWDFESSLYLFIIFIYLPLFLYICFFFYSIFILPQFLGFYHPLQLFYLEKKNLLKWKIWWRQGKGKMHWSQFWRKDANLAWFKSFFNSNEI